ncbi:hypothetical protein M8J77_025518 [Diaphorina citri]|nr:hypothetical protein M8J77_025518 [Diaphorina citri]
MRRINLTGFYKAQYDNRRCWQKVTTAKYYFMFLEYKQGRLSAYEDEKRGAFTPWSQDNITVVWHALGWSDWSDWTICSSKCGGGTQERWRYCERGGGCQSWNKERRTCNDFPCEGVVDPLEIKSNAVLQHMGRQWERVPGRETAWRLRKGSYLWLPGNEVAFPKVNFQGACSVLISLRVHANGKQQGTILSLKSRRQKNVYLSLELYDSKFIRLVHSNANSTVQSVVIPSMVGDGKWHQIAIGILDNNRIHSYVDCEWVYNYLLPRESLDTPEDADLVVGYLFTGDIEQLLLVPNSDAIKHQCINKSTVKFLDRAFLNTTTLSFPPTKIPPDLSNVNRLISPEMDPPTEDPIDHFVLTSYLTKRHSIASNLSGDSNSLHEDFNGMLGDQPHKDKLMDQWYEGSTAEASDKLLLAAVKELPSTEEGSHLGWTQDDASRDTEDDDLEGSGLENAAMYEVEWSHWGKCSATCGGGTQTRHSRCVDMDVKKLELCLQSGDERVESRTCNAQPCPTPSHHLRRKNMILSLLGSHRVEDDTVRETAFPSCPCLNGGQCANFEPKSVWPYLTVELHRKCHCVEGYTGKLCEVPVCRATCEHGGTCVRPDTCYCPKLYTGPTCKDPVCEPPCQHGGICSSPNHCSCPVETSGPNCETLNCTSETCNNESCSSANASSVQCPTLTCTPPCQNGGTCASNNVCLCNHITTGDRCETNRCEMRPVQEPYTRGFRRVAKSHNKCRFNNLRLCVKQFPHYETVYKTYYQTELRCMKD